ncbi:hypothetical protein SHIRM173S_10085 [Streptomyces hirsutus]
MKFSFNKAFSTAFYEISGHYILPKHIWSKVKDPAKFTNPNPVGTGPYTKIEKFQSQSYELRPRLLAAGQTADRRYPDARLLRQRQRQHRLHQR